MFFVMTVTYYLITSTWFHIKIQGIRNHFSCPSNKVYKNSNYGKHIPGDMELQWEMPELWNFSYKVKILIFRRTGIWKIMSQKSLAKNCEVLAFFDTKNIIKAVSCDGNKTLKYYRIAEMGCLLLPFNRR